MDSRKVQKDCEESAESFINGPLWTGSFYTDDALGLLRERFDELMRERRGQFVETPTSAEEAETNTRSTQLRFAA